MEVDGIHIIRDAREAAAALQNDTLIGFDTETTGLSPWRDKLATMQFYGDQSGAAAVIQLPGGVVPEELKALFTKDRTFICHNAVAFDILMLDTHGVPWQNTNWFDTLVGETVCVSSGRKNIRKSLKAGLKRRLNVSLDKDIAHGHWTEELTDKQITYAISDVIHLPAYYRSLLVRAAETGQFPAMQLEQEIVPYVAKMTINGLPCYTEKMYEFMAQQQKIAGEMYNQVVATFGDINFNSHVQIKQAVRSKYGKSWKSTAEAVLLDMVYDSPEDAPLAQLLLDYRAPLQRLKMYDDEWISDYVINNVIHSRFWQCSADTGRFTSSDPNLQQWPRDARWVIGNKPGWEIISADYSQIEVRAAAYLANDEELLAALENEDIHATIASLLFKIPLSEVTKDQRRKAKAAAFALLYCGGVKRLYGQARQDGSPMTLEEASQVFEAFFGRFKGLWRMRQQAIRAAQTRQVNTIRMPSTLRRILVGADNKPSIILNNTVQGFAAAGMKQAIRIAGGHGLFDYIGAQVHDELVAATESRHAVDFGEALKADMLEGMGMYLPVAVKAKVTHGTTW